MHVLIIEGFRPGHEMLKSLGAEISMIIEAYRISGNEDGFYDRYLTVTDNAEVDEWIQQARKINDVSKIDSVINFHENRQLETAKIAEALGLPYHNAEEALICKDKIYMRSFLISQKVDSIMGGPLSTLQKKLDAHSVNFPLIVKPYNGWGSSKIFKVENKQHLDEVTRFCLNDDEYPLYCFEEFVTGTEYSVETFSQNGMHKIVCMTKKYNDSNFVETGHCVPAALSTTEYTAIKGKVISLLRALGHDNGPMHTEVIVSPAGDVHIVETHLRMGGDKIPEMIEYACGFNLLKAWCKQILGANVFDAVPEVTSANTSSYVAIRYQMAGEQQIGRKIRGVKYNFSENVKSRILEVNSVRAVGDSIVKSANSFTRLGYIIVEGNDYRETEQLADLIKDEMVYELE